MAVLGLKKRKRVTIQQGKSPKKVFKTHENLNEGLDGVSGTDLGNSEFADAEVELPKN